MGLSSQEEVASVSVFQVGFGFLRSSPGDSRVSPRQEMKAVEGQASSTKMQSHLVNVLVVFGR